MEIDEKLFEQNRAWAERIKREDPAFFQRLSEQQSPEILWIGCSDSRVPANQLLKLAPGEVFVHRNIANVVVHTDLNCLSVIQYAVEVLKVRHIIVCGHYGCGGVEAALGNQEFGLIDNWLRHIKDVYRFHKAKVDECQTPRQKLNRMCELNVIEQVANVCHTTIVQKAWKGGQQLSVHGWIYSIEDGILKDLAVRVNGNEAIEEIHRMQ
ncbi:carbonate dehydratase [Motiliproteus sediminis]|uniref:carbonate dehydratase n=1 Tax=Motiliproteus sediminis TaxID=1468178 RepID=UPI001AEFD655|nr:carbonate dehydratase [Motiliproteus sediminis]